MSSNISTKLVRVDIEEIRKNYIKPEFWKKRWNIFKCNKGVYYMRILEISVTDMKILFEISKDCSWMSQLFYVPIEHPEYTQEKFSIDIERKLLSLIYQQEISFLRGKRGYVNAIREEIEIEESIEKQTKDFLKSIGEKREKVIDTYTKAVTEEYWENHEKPTDIFLNANEYKHFTNVFILALTWFENQKIFDEYMLKFEKLGKKVSNVALLTWKMKKELSENDFVKQYLEKENKQ